MNLLELHSTLSAPRRYALAVLIFTLALALRFTLFPVELGLAFITFFPATVLTFALCGVGPGILVATMGSIVGAYIFIPPHYSFEFDESGLIAIATFLFSAYLIGYIVNQLHKYSETLHQSKQQLTGLLEDQTEVICRFKLDGTILYVNNAFCQLFGKSRESLIGQSWAPVAYPEDVPLINEKLKSLSLTNDVVTITNRIIDSAGNIRWMQFINRAIFDKQGNLIESQAVGRDITAQKALQDKENEEHQQLQQIASSVPGMIYQYLLHHDGTAAFPYASEAIREIYRLAPKDVKEDAAAVLAIIHPDDFQGVVDSIMQSAQTLQPWKNEYRVRYADGTERWLYGNAVPNQMDNGSILWNGYITDITDLKTVEHALLRESEKNKAILRNASDGIHIIDIEGNVIEASQSFCDMLGYKYDEVIGMNITQWDEDLSDSERMRIVKEQFKNPVRSQFERRHVRKDGSVFDVEISGFPLELDGKSVLFNSSHEITDRKKLEVQLQSTVKEVEDLYDHAPCGYHSVGHDGKYLRINATELEWLGCSREDVIGRKSPSDFFTPASRDLFKQNFPAFMRDGYTENIEFELVDKNGDIKQVTLNATAIRDEQGNFIMSRSILFDMTEFKKIENALRSSEQRFRMMANSAPVLIWIAGLDKACHWFNNVWLEFTGRTMEQETGNGWADGVHPDDFDRCLDLYVSHFDKHEAFRMQYRLRRHDGEYRWIDDNGVPLLDNDGNFSGYIGSCIDVTESKQLTLELQEALSKLGVQTERLQTILENASDAIHILDMSGNVIQFSQSFARMLGYTNDEIAHLNVADWDAQIPKDQLPEILKNLSNTPAIFETKHHRKDGSVLDVEINATEVKLDGKSYLYASSRDISERKEYEQKLRLLSLEQQAMLDNELVGIIKLKGRQILWRNKAIDRIFGYGSDELVGASTRILYPDILAFQALGDAAYPVLHDNGVYRTQLEMVRKNGDRIWIDLSGVQLSAENGHSMWMMTDITPIKRHDEEVTKIAYHDILTKLPNRLLLADRLTQSLAQAERSKRMLAVCYLDLDTFKPVNDNFGHEAGDKVLIEIASRMQAALRINDTVARLGGDEFVLLLADLESAEEYQLVIARVIEAINQPIVLDESNQVNVGASIGIALFPDDSNDANTLLRHADLAMYQAKQSGLNRVCLFTSEMAEN